MKLPLAYYGDSILRQKASTVEAITDELRQLIDDMVETMHAHNGIGLSAPQVGHSIAVFITFWPNHHSDGTVTHGPVRVFINPKLSSPSQEHTIHPEGCLSIPRIYGDVARPFEITVSYITLEGKKVTETFTDWPARVIMHENDHLNGVLFFDRMSPKERKKLEIPLLQLKKKLTSKKTRCEFDSKMSNEREI